MAQRYLILFILAVLLLPALPASAAEPGEEALTIVYTGNTFGKMTSCPV